MDYGMIGKIEKAKRYVEERSDRIRFQSFTVAFNGAHDTHTITFSDGGWTCTCNFFQTRGVCSHTMALERILEGMIPDPAQEEG
ncbi:MAG: SWIM zinc finger family protein [Anaerolineae bacterium]|nr:SWIM zinc finger family protein [Anaerolineae bacterium]